MKSVKWTMLNLHLWCMILDIMITVLTVPLLIFPVLGGYPLGILTNWFAGVLVSILLIFENRYYRLYARESIWKQIRVGFISINYLLVFTFFIPVSINYPDQNVALQFAHNKIPILSKDIKSENIFVLAIDYNAVMPVNYMTAFICLETTVFIKLIYRNLNSGFITRSQNTVKLQKSFLKAIYAQITVFLINFGFPILYVPFTVIFNYYNQSINNLVFVAIALHGISSTSIMIWAHKPYRESSTSTPISSPMAPEAVKRKNNARRNTAQSSSSDSSQGSSSTAPNPIESLNTARNTALPPSRKNGMKCCDETMTCYNCANLPCDGDEGCKIQQDSWYWMEKKESKGQRDQFCLKCAKNRFTKKVLEQKFSKEENVETEKEEEFKCVDCGGLFHRMCTYLFNKNPSSYRCHECRDPEVIKNLDALPKSEMDHFISDKVNRKLIEYMDDEEKALKQKISIRNVHSARSSVDTKKLAPGSHLKQFEERYGKKLDFTERTIMAFQRNGDTDILFFIMYVQEYIMKDGVGWTVLDYLDTVPYVTPFEKKGEIYQEIILSYWQYMANHGFSRAHFWAKAPVKGDDYIFHIHPRDQYYLDQSKLEGWYKKLLGVGKANGLVEEFRVFREEEEAGNMREFIDYPVFKESIWPCMFGFSKLDVEEGVAQDFEAAFEKNKGKHQNDNFYVYFKTPVPGIAAPPSIPMQNIPLFGSRGKFNKLCDDNKWEFATLRRAKYSSIGIIGVLAKHLKKLNAQRTPVNAPLQPTPNENYASMTGVVVGRTSRKRNQPSSCQTTVKKRKLALNDSQLNVQ
uniref:histone acetyltransferase n=1 Tax=Caenorhabditis tropicalis TaxID=1561998 RepID=A0A1I7TW00_9PELO